MAKASLKKNFFYKGLLTLANPIMGMVTFPYVSRVLGVENIGLVNFVDNTVSYFLLFATMGIGTLGVRAIATANKTKEDLNRTFSNVFGLNLLFTCSVLLVYNLLVFTVPGFRDYSELFYIGNAKILFSSLLIEWFFNGIENFKYITIRSLLVRFIYVISIFLFIKCSGDYKLYFSLTVLVTVVNALINLIYSRRFVQIVPKYLISKRFLRENIKLGIYAIMTSMYLTFNVMFLGLNTNNIEVGYYTSAYKLYHLILSVFGAFSSVMLPRMSALIAENNNDQFACLINKSMEFVAMFSIPLILCCSIMAPEIIYLLCGSGYEGAILPMRIIMPALIVVGMSHVLAMQVLVPQNKDNVLLKASVIGAVLSLIVNVLLVDKFQSIGSAIVLLVSETSLTLTYLWYILSHRIIRINYSVFVRYALTALPSAAVCVLTKVYIDNPIISLVIAVCFGVLMYVVINLKHIQKMLNIKSFKI